MLNFLRKALDYAAYKLIREPRGGGKPVPEAALDHEYSSGQWDSFFSPQEQPRYDALVATIRHAHPCPCLLDIGCGSGRLAQLLLPEHITTYTGLDLSAEGLRRARSLGLQGTHFLHADFETWRSDELHDVIVINETLGYARDPARVALAFASQLQPGGCLVVSYFRAGNHAALWQRLDRHFHFADEKVIHNSTGLTWDIKTLQLRPLP